MTEELSQITVQIWLLLLLNYTKITKKLKNLIQLMYFQGFFQVLNTYVLQPIPIQPWLLRETLDIRHLDLSVCLLPHFLNVCISCSRNAKPIRFRQFVNAATGDSAVV